MGLPTAHGVTNIEGYESGAFPAVLGDVMPSAGAIFITAGAARTGTYKLAVVSGATPNYHMLPVHYGTEGSVSTFNRDVIIHRQYALFSINSITGGTWMRILSTGENWNGFTNEHDFVEMDSNGFLRVNGGASSNPLSVSIGGYHLIEFLSDADANIQEVYVDGFFFASNTTVHADMDWIAVGNYVGGAGLLVSVWDDALVESADLRADVNLSHSDGANLRMFQDGDAALNGWTGVPGPNKWDDVDEVVADGDTSYNTWATVPVGAEQEYTYQTAAAAGLSFAAGETIKAVKVQTRNKYIGVVGAHMNQRLHSGGTTNVTLTQAAQATYQTRTAKVYRFDPDTGLPWTEAGLNALITGVTHLTNGQELRVTQQLLSVDWGPPFTPTTFNPDLNPESLGGFDRLNPPEILGG